MKKGEHFRCEATNLDRVIYVLKILKKVGINGLNKIFTSELEPYYYQSLSQRWRFCLLKSSYWYAYNLSPHGESLIKLTGDDRRKMMRHIVMHTIPMFLDLVEILYWEGGGEIVHRDSDIIEISIGNRGTLTLSQVYDLLDKRHEARFGQSYGYSQPTRRIKTVKALLEWLKWTRLAIPSLSRSDIWKFDRESLEDYLNTQPKLFDDFVEDMREINRRVRTTWSIK